MSMKLSILGLLLERNMHPYEMMLIMRDRAMDRVTKLQMGSLYYAVDQLAKAGQIEPVQVIRSTDRPDKTIYGITDKGRQLFDQLIFQQFRKSEPVYHSFHLALVYSRHADQQKLARVLEERIRDTEHELNLAYQVYEEHIETVPRAALHLMYGRYEHLATELKWLRRLHADMAAGRMGERGRQLEE